MPPDDEEVVVTLESKATAEEQKAAREMGWIPPERFKGDHEKYVDADEFIKRGETVLPIIKKQNKDLHDRLATETAARVQLEKQLKETQAAVEEIDLRWSVEAQKRVETAKKDLKTALRQAIKDDDKETQVSLLEQIDNLDEAIEAAKTEEKPAKPKVDVAPVREVPQEVKDWLEENSWYGKDHRKTGLFDGIARDLRANGEKATGAKFFDLVLDEMTEEAPAKVDKVDGGRHSGGNGAARNAKKGYDRLPADAKAQCDADAREFVGKGKNQFKTLADWRNQYAEVYFRGEA